MVRARGPWLHMTLLLVSLRWSGRLLPLLMSTALTSVRHPWLPWWSRSSLVTWGVLSWPLRWQTEAGRRDVCSTSTRPRPLPLGATARAARADPPRSRRGGSRRPRRVRPRHRRSCGATWVRCWCRWERARRRSAPRRPRCHNAPSARSKAKLGDLSSLESAQLRIADKNLEVSDLGSVGETT